MKLSQNTLIVVALVVVLAGAAAYFLFFQQGGEAVSVENVQATEAEFVFINLVAQIEPISFNQAVFEDPRFKALVDIRTVIIPEPSGRTDPFGPVSGISNAE